MGNIRRGKIKTRVGAPTGLTDKKLQLVVGLGASAGGLQAIEEFFAAKPPIEGAAYILIQHLSPDFRSWMDQILMRISQMPVIIIQKRTKIESGNIYLIPPSNDVVIEKDEFVLIDRKLDGGVHHPIDTLFRSLAQSYGARSVGIVLSGTGTDGTAGAGVIHNEGGFILVQDSASAKFASMPQSAERTGLYDFVLSPKDMAAALKSVLEKGDRCIADAQPELLSEDERQSVSQIFDLFLRRYGLDFSVYRINTILRRIERRIVIGRYGNMEAYVKDLKENEAELSRLYRDLLIGVTEFFRDPVAFQTLQMEAFTLLVDQSQPNSDLRIWVPGCSTGEEAYSLAILFKEFCDLNHVKREVKIFATDVHPTSLEVASQGIYSDLNALRSVSRARVSKYFVRKGEAFQISPEIRSMVIFAKHNALKDPPFTRVHLISCRNLLIYLNNKTHDLLLARFHFALRKGGVLFLGPSESLGTYEPEFEPIHREFRIFVKKRDLPTEGAHLAVAGSALSNNSLVPAARVSRVVDRHGDLALGRALTSYLNRYFSPCVVLNDKREVIRMFGDVNNLFQVSSGRVSFDILNLTAGELRMAIGSSIQKAKRDDNEVTFKGVQFGEKEKAQHLDLTVRPFKDPAENREYFLIWFDRRQGRYEGRQQALQSDFDASEVSKERIIGLEDELDRTRSHLKAVVEELEFSNEQLQSANEELMSANEELQSANEELHSVNEELYTVNAEHERKIEELAIAHADIQNLFASVNIATLFLDADFRIRLFNPSAQKIFSLLPQDLDRPLQQLAQNFQGFNLIEVVRSVIETSKPFEQEIKLSSGGVLIARIFPYRMRAGSSDGAVVTFVDITESKRSAEKLIENEEIIRLALEAANLGLWTWSREGNRVELKGSLWKMQGLAEKLRSTSLDDLETLVSPAERERIQGCIRGCLSSGAPLQFDLTLPLEGRSISLSVLGSVDRDADGEIENLVGVCMDITDRKSVEQHLENLVAKRTQALATSERRLRAVISAVTSVVLTTNANCEIMEYQRPWAIYTGQTDREMMGMGWMRCVHEEDKPQFQKTFAEIVARGGDGRFNVRIFSKAFQSYRHCEGRILPLMEHIEDQQAQEWVWAITDVDEIVRSRTALKDLNLYLEDKISERTDALSRSNEDLKQFAYIASHDLQEPLRVISMYSTLVERSLGDGLPAATKSYFESIRSASKRMSNLINGILSYGRIDSKGGELCAVHFGDVVERVIQNLRTTIDESRAEVITPRTFPVVMGDQSQLIQVLQNLISNAIKFQREGVIPRVELNYKESGDFIEFTLIDNGIGIAKEHRERIFKIFERLHSRDRYQGTGIGLSICKRIIERHGGKIWVDSDDEVGSQFHFTLRMQRAKAM